jgi:ABC-type uncharacterized transport system permease subunit
MKKIRQTIIESIQCAIAGSIFGLICALLIATL